ncbi:MAG: thermonuclease family protein [Pleurocapsa sp. MO_226.B13]|nr:thermonuclease family protein [Pleurocapsa sp. MO_226.B13]
MRSLVDIGNGELLIVPIEKDRYQRTVAEVYVKDSQSTAINLNVQMVRDGYAWHYEKYSGNCPIRGEFAIAQELAQKEGLGIWNGSPQPPWLFRRQANK